MLSLIARYEKSAKENKGRVSLTRDPVKLNYSADILEGETRPKPKEVQEDKEKEFNMLYAYKEEQQRERALPTAGTVVPIPKEKKPKPKKIKLIKDEYSIIKKKRGRPRKVQK